MSFVLDSSVTLAWCFEDEHTDMVLALLDRVTQAGAVAPALWPLEVQNGLLVAERRKRMTAATRQTLAHFVAELPVRLDSETAERAWGPTQRIAEQYGLTAYDACYLELAFRRQLPLATLDRQLARAATAVGTDLLTS